ncbi:hypothetical protein [Piscinibacter koreensis]|uniref:Secreted protein n=1 Tax=Piscinibacter koreensis TaxID=2742824 RepID=A0A7Y6NMC2_9BURK|nr:hypothetical protein [Schlegelella koreensis]NUZ05843.1 hypothetical protein [Schlegelella koreensis]
MTREPRRPHRTSRRPQRRSLPVLLGTLATLAACSAPGVAQPGRAAPGASAASAASGAVAVYKPLGSRQCEVPPPRATLERELAAAGVPVLGTACGRDGRMRAALCGAPDGRIVIFEVPTERVAAAAAAGFEPLANLPDATREPCPGS